jgi:hypothetical protein
MQYTIKNAEGVACEGDDTLDDVVKAVAEVYGGHVEDENGLTVYTSKAKLERDKVAVE